jgi:hypothetical protein
MIIFTKKYTMNWIQFPNLPKIEVVQGFTYSGPLKTKNTWSNFSYHVVKVKCPKDFDFKSLIGIQQTGFVYKKQDQFLSCSFTLLSTRGLSDCKTYKIVSLEVQDFISAKVSKEYERDLKLSEIFE